MKSFAPAQVRHPFARLFLDNSVLDKPGFLQLAIMRGLPRKGKATSVLTRFAACGAGCCGGFVTIKEQDVEGRIA
jgi:hypothetical protein